MRAAAAADARAIITARSNKWRDYGTPLRAVASSDMTK